MNLIIFKERGEPGELYISGLNVSLGYLNNEEMTKKSFVHIKKFGNSVFYKTGDIAYWNEEGYLSFVGRKDSQIKFKGHRIELNEINNTIKNIKGIQNSITLLKEVNGIMSLCSYVSVYDKTLTADFIKTSISDYLPYYMIPSHIVILDSMPITKNGKIDKASLPEIVIETTKIVLPKTLTQIKLYNILCDLLNLKNFSILDNFFNLGLDSLLGIRFSLKIYQEFNKNLPISDLFKYTNIASLAEHLDNLDADVSFEDILIAPKSSSYPLSSAQKRIYYAQKMAGSDSLLYNISGGFLIKKRLDIEKIEDAFNKIIEHNSSFRTYFKLENGKPRQFILDSFHIDIPYFEENNVDNSLNEELLIGKDAKSASSYQISFDNLNSKVTEDLLIKKLVNNFPKAFDLQFAPLLRVEVHYINDKTLVLIDSHHIILDGTSLNLLISEFCSYYDGEEVLENEIEYKDYAVWENKLIKSNALDNIRKYWIDRFKDYDIPVINLPYDYAKTNTLKYNGNKLNFKIDDDLFNKIKEIAQKFEVSDYMLFLACFYCLLYKYTAQENIALVSPIEARNSVKLHNLIGMFVNNIVLNQTLDSNMNFKDFLANIKTMVLDSLHNQPYPYDMLIKDLGIVSNNSPFEVVFTYQNENNDIYDKNLDLSIIGANTNTSKFNLTFEIDPSKKQINIEYNTDLFACDTIVSFYEHYIYILNQLNDDLDMTLNDFDIITPKEARKLEDFNNTDGEINSDTVTKIFERVVLENANNTAVICDGKTLTYGELNKKANSLAHLLIKKGIKPNDIVCIMTNRSLETIVCMMGILKAGAAFLNVDPTYPIERTEYYLKDCNAQYVLTMKSLKDKVSSIKNCIEIDLDNDFYNRNFENPNVKVDPQDLSYVIYTSGSTGLPKGVLLNQVGFANMAKAMTSKLDYLKEGNNHCLVSVTSTPFDIFVYEIIVSLTHGLKILLANNAEHRNPVLLDALIKKYGGDVMTVTPSLMKINYDNRLEDSALSRIKYMVFGGEPLPEKFVKDLRRLSKGVSIYNIYGPSEITILSNVQNLDKENKITVGPPILNTQIHILDKNLKRVPIGVVGEIYISGIQVGLGYLGKPKMTEEKFLNNLFGPGKMYKSGDLGRWTFDGKVQILGRIDNQIKLRGLRIELGEIEGKMEEIPGVQSAVVNKVDYEGREFLCGYYVTEKNEVVMESTIKEALRRSLPYYMVPTYIVHLEEMPYTINRKIDRKALPMPKFKKSTSNSDLITDEKLTPQEKILLNIWKNILNVDNISIYDNFFDIGGDSILAINMQIDAFKNGFKFEYADIFNYPTIKALASKTDISYEDVLKNYDYTKINKLLEANDIKNLDSIVRQDAGDCLLIGSTGFLGAHLIYSWLKQESGHIYCLIRRKDNFIPLERLKNTLNFYLGPDFYKENESRITVLEGDITKKDLGMSSSDYEMVSKNVTTVINSGAIVKHYGQKELFEEINVHGTQNVVNLCKTLNKRLIHISTISVSGNGEKEEAIIETPENINNKKLFTEKSLYIKQNLKGIYTITKFKAERIVYEGILDGLDAKVLRIGNITNRYSDGLFQRNASENAFAKRLKSFINIGAVPDYATKHEIELTPVDLCADAIIKIAQYKSKCNVFHVFDVKLLPIKLLLETLSELGFNLVPVPEHSMTQIINELLNNDNNKDILSGIIHDLDKEKRLIYTSNIKLDASFTVTYLKKIGFEWKSIDKEYIFKYINYFKKIKFFGI